MRVDLKDIAPQTLATLSFDLLGFGSKNASVTINDVMMITNGQSALMTTSDTATTTQASSVAINVLNNDRDIDDSHLTSAQVASKASASAQTEPSPLTTQTKTPSFHF